MSLGECPIPISDYPTITLAHGGGGRLTQMLMIYNERLETEQALDSRQKNLVRSRSAEKFNYTLFKLASIGFTLI